jgi:hypothetical protein
MVASSNASSSQERKSIELMFELERQGYAHVASVANCGRAAKQYDVALVDWWRRTLRSLETTLDWLVDFLHAEGVLVVATDPQKSHARETLSAALEKPGFVMRIQSSMLAAMPFRPEAVH